MKTCQILLGLFTVILVYQVRSEVKTQSSPVFIPFRGSTWINCSTPVPDNTRLESRLQKIDNQTGPNWYAVKVIVDDWENSTLYCMYEEVIIPTIVMAYALPSDITIDLQTELNEGEEYTINCTVYEVAPLEYLTIYISRGGDVIYNKSYTGPHVENRQTVSHSYTFTASREDNLKNFSCDAVLQLGSERHPFTSPEETVRTYTLPEAPVIRVEKWIENGTSFTVECLVTNGFPSENVTLEMFIEDTPLEDIHVVTNEGSVRGTVQLNASYPSLGLKTIHCESLLFDLSTETMENITIYELPTTSFSISSNITNLEENVTATCHITNKHVGAYGLIMQVDGNTVQENPNDTLTYIFPVRRRTPSHNFSCTAYIIGNKSISQSSIETLQVHYPPEFIESLCPSSFTLVQGEKKFSCQADGNPKPKVECSADGHYIDDMVTVTRNMTGNYTCKATNERGDATKAVQVIVQYAPMTPTVTISPNSTLRTGDPLNITCTSDGLPAPTYSWKIPNNAKVTFSQDKSSIIIHDATSSHNGTYACVASNQHGEARIMQEATIVSDGVNIGLIIALILGGLGLIAIITAILHYCWKKGRKGFYELLGKNQSRSHQNGNIPLNEQSTIAETNMETSIAIPNQSKQ